MSKLSGKLIGIAVVVLLVINVVVMLTKTAQSQNKVKWEYRTIIVEAESVGGELPSELIAGLTEEQKSLFLNNDGTFNSAGLNLLGQAMESAGRGMFETLFDPSLISERLETSLEAALSEWSDFMVAATFDLNPEKPGTKIGLLLCRQIGE